MTLRYRYFIPIPCCCCWYWWCLTAAAFTSNSHRYNIYTIHTTINRFPHSNNQPLHRFPVDRLEPEPATGATATVGTRSHLLTLQGTRKEYNYHRARDVQPSTPRIPLGKFITSIFRFIIAHIAKFIMKTMNRTHLHDPHNNLRYIFSKNADNNGSCRKDDVGILTISNHQSILDDPGIWCGIVPLRKLRLEALRTILLAEEWYYALGKFSASILRGLNCLPIHRGDLRGLNAPSLKEMYCRLNGMSLPLKNGESERESESDEEQMPKMERTKHKREWAHLMVEGRLNQSWRFKENEPKLGKFRRGAAKLIACSPPHKLMVLPIYHRGMDEIFPEEKPNSWENNHRISIAGRTKCYFPRWGKRVDVYVGDFICFEDLVPHNGYAFDEVMDDYVLKQINHRLFQSMLVLERMASKDRGNK